MSLIIPGHRRRINTETRQTVVVITDAAMLRSLRSIGQSFPPKKTNNASLPRFLYLSFFYVMSQVIHYFFFDQNIVPPGADLLGHVDALLGGGELGHELGDVAAGALGLDGALLRGLVLHDGLHLVVALLRPLHTGY